MKDFKIGIKQLVDIVWQNYSYLSSLIKEDNSSKQKRNSFFTDKRIVNGGKSWTYIPSEPIYTLNAISVLEKTGLLEKENTIVYDLGCGFSPLLTVLSSIKPKWYAITGYEFDKRIISAMEDRSNYRLKECDLINDWVDSPNKFNLRNEIPLADFIYLYMPIADEDLYCDLIYKCFESMKEGAILADFYGQYTIKDRVLPKFNSLEDSDWKIQVEKVNEFNCYFKKVKK